MAVTKLSDVIVPAIFTPYAQIRTEEKSALIQSGVAARDAQLDALLAGAGLTFNVPSWNDLDHGDEENISNDDETEDSSPSKIGTVQEVGVRLSRNKSWSSMRLVQALAGSDPMQAIGNLVSDYWVGRMQAAFIATVQGVFAENATATASDHVQNDLTVDLSGLNGGVFLHGTTDFSADAFIDAATTLGDGASSVTAVAVHSIVYARMQKNNLIDFIPDSNGVVNIPVFLGRRVIIDDGMPNPAGRASAQTAAGVFHSWLLGPGAFRIGVGSAEVPTEVDRKPAAGNGAGQEILFSRVEWMIHPVGHKYNGSSPNGGPSNASTTNNLANAASWLRVYPERKQIKIARLITRES